jgi:hypothetical protein
MKNNFTKIVVDWLDKNILFYLSLLLVVFIPIYPKIPLADIIPGYIVRIRLEDVLIFISFLIFTIQLFRKKVTIKVPFYWFIVAYLGFGLLSILSAVFLIKTIPLEMLHFGKSALHLFRYFEYFFLYFLVFNSIKTKKQLKIIIFSFVFTLLSINIYAVGQKYFFWPVYSTMNREFSKGIRLYLSPHARVQSTFAGHYDLGAYLVIVLPLVFSLSLIVKKKWKKIILLAVHFFGFWLLISAASRSSFFSFILAIMIVIFGFSFFVLKKKFWQKVGWFLSRSLIYLIISGILFVSFGDDIYERLLQTLEAYPKLHKTYHYCNDKRKFFINDVVLVKLGIKDMRIKKAEPPKNGLSTEDAMVMVSSDTRPEPVRSDDDQEDSQKPSDVYVDVPDVIMVASKSATGEDIMVEKEVPRTYSETAMKEGLSMGIRKDALWPQAIKGWQKNILLGSGYATLNKNGFTHFTEAESTDNNFLRTLGETGLLGFLSFYGFILVNVFMAVKTVLTKTVSQVSKVAALVFGASSLGLLLNACMIDVFAASKVAFIYWSFTALFYLVLKFNNKKTELV